MATVTTSKQFSLNWQDLWKGLKVAVILPILVIIQQSIEKGEFSFDWKLIGLTAVGGLIAYLIKNFFTPAEIVVKDAPKETVEAVKAGEADVEVVNK
jgi:hypothetical protein